MRNGDFSADPTLIYDPATTAVEGGSTIRTRFPGNVIPANRIDPIARRLTEYWPLPNGPGLVSNYLSSSGTGANVFRHDTKIDYTLSSRDTLSGRFSYYDNEVIGAQTFPGPANPNLTAYQRIKAPAVQANYTRTFSPRVLNEFRAGWQRNRMDVSGEQSSYDDWRTRLGLPQLFSDPSASVRISQHSAGRCGHDRAINSRVSLLPELHGIHRYAQLDARQALYQARRLGRADPLPGLHSQLSGRDLQLLGPVHQPPRRCRDRARLRRFPARRVEQRERDPQPGRGRPAAQHRVRLLRSGRLPHRCAI